MSRILSSLITICVLLTSFPVHGAILRVDATSTAQNPDGSTWALAYPALEDALGNANSSDEIRIAQGVYKPGTSRSNSFVIADANVIVRGGYAGLQEQNPDTNDPILYTTILSGDIGQTGVHTDNCYQVVSAVYQQTTAFTLENVTIRHGYADGGGGTSQGGGIYLDDVDATIRNCIIESNYAADNGGGIASSGDARLEGCTIRGNESDAIGGGMYSRGEPIIINCRFIDNDAAVFGGGLGARNCAPRIISSTFASNSVSSSFGGGGMYLDEAPQSSSVSPQIVNCLFYENIAPNGAGMRTNELTYLIASCTFADNVASSSAHSLYVNSSNDTVTVVNSIFWNQGTFSGTHITHGSATLDVEYSDVQLSSGTWSGDGNINTDPKFVHPATDNYHLWCNSLARDAGDETLTPYDAFDIDGDGLDDQCTPCGTPPCCERTPDRDIKPRVMEDEIEMGCYERPPDGECQGDADGDGLTDVIDLLLVINTWGTCPGSGAVCAGDVDPSTCGGNGVVNVDDLLEVINGWGACEFAPPGTFEGSMPTSVDECWDTCDGKHPNDWEEFVACFNGCVDALCAAGIINCD